MRIGFLLSSFYPNTGGREVITFSLAKELVKRGHKVHIFTSLTDNLKPEETVEGIYVHRTKTLFQYKYYLEFNPGWIKNVLKYKLDVLHIQSFGFMMADLAVLLEKLLHGTKIVNTPHGPFMALTDYPLWQKALKKVYEAIEFPINKKYDAVIQVNPEQWRWMTKVGVKRNNIFLVPNSIPKEMFMKVSNKDFIKRHNLKNKLVISYLGRIQEYKGLDQVIRVLPDLIKINKSIIFLAMGKDAGDMDRLKKLALELKVSKNVIFTGLLSHEDKLKALDVSEIAVLPSEWEAFGICVPPDTLIRVPEGVKTIKNISIGEKVLTHKGRFMAVKKIMSRRYNSKILIIKTKNDSSPLLITPEHPILAVRSKYCAWKHKALNNVICKPCCPERIHCLHRYYKNYKPEWIKASDIKVGDFIVSTFNREIKDIKSINLLKVLGPINESYFKIQGEVIISKTGHNLSSNISYDTIAKNLKLGRGTIYRVVNSQQKVSDKTRRKVLDYLAELGYKVTKITIPKDIRLNNETLRLFGYYLAEGNVGTNGQIEFAFHIKEKEYHKDVLKIMKNEFGLYGTLRKRGNGVVIGFNSVLIASFFKKMCCGYARTKMVHPIFSRLSLEKQKELVKGYWRGDGTITPTGFSITTVSPNLAYQFREILLRLGLNVSLVKIIDKKYGPKYILNFGGISLEATSYILGEKHKFLNSKKRLTSYNWVNGNKLFIRVKSISHKKYAGEVYNLEVDKDNSYVAQSITLHNCIIESMARGNAIISTKTEGGKFLIKEGVNGYLYDYKDLPALKSQLLALIKNNQLRKRIINNNLRLSKKFSTENITTKLENVYRMIR